MVAIRRRSQAQVVQTTLPQSPQPNIVEPLLKAGDIIEGIYQSKIDQNTRDYELDTEFEYRERLGLASQEARKQGLTGQARVDAVKRARDELTDEYISGAPANVRISALRETYGTIAGSELLQTFEEEENLEVVREVDRVDASIASLQARSAEHPDETQVNNEHIRAVAYGSWALTEGQKETKTLTGITNNTQIGELARLDTVQGTARLEVIGVMRDKLNAGEYGLSAEGTEAMRTKLDTAEINTQKQLKELRDINDDQALNAIYIEAIEEGADDEAFLEKSLRYFYNKGDPDWVKKGLAEWQNFRGAFPQSNAEELSSSVLATYEYDYVMGRLTEDEYVYGVRTDPRINPADRQKGVLKTDKLWFGAIPGLKDAWADLLPELEASLNVLQLTDEQKKSRARTRHNQIKSQLELAVSRGLWVQERVDAGVDFAARAFPTLEQLNDPKSPFYLLHPTTGILNGEVQGRKLRQDNQRGGSNSTEEQENDATLTNILIRRIEGGG